MKAFNRRVYTLKGFLTDLMTVVMHPVLSLGILWGFFLEVQFRERLYLAVIAVNGCRYCSYLHTRSALQSGLSREDVDFLLSGIADHVPMQEARAMLYAQHWADTRGRPDPQVRAELIRAYGEKTGRAIEMTLRLIQIGSLSGNSFDWFLYHLSCGRLGVIEKETS